MSPTKLGTQLDIFQRKYARARRAAPLFPASGDSGLCPVCMLRKLPARNLQRPPYQVRSPNAPARAAATNSLKRWNSARSACSARLLPGRVESGESSAAEDAVKPTPDQTEQRFDHYELVTGEDGKPVELGRGAMGVTYKAFDVDLRYHVALKVISERYLGDESARLRFLREARAAASVRHPNVAWVLHLGRTGRTTFTRWSLSRAKRLRT